MKSRNEWCVIGEVVGISTRKRSVVVSIKGNIFRPSLFNVRGIIECVLSNELYEVMKNFTVVEVKGKMIFGKDNYLLVDKVKKQNADDDRKSARKTVSII